MKRRVYKIHKISLIMLFSLLNFGSLFAQAESTKIKDGTISSGAEKAFPGALFELESVKRGMLTSRMTTEHRNAIAASSLTDGLLVFNTTTGCFDYWSQSQSTWLSICGTPPPAVLNISTVQCNSVKPNGNYKQGVALGLSNYLTVPVTVTQPGTFTVSATTDNGYYFTTSGTFPSAGNYELSLAGIGTPNSGYNAGDAGDNVTIVLNGKGSDCKPHIFVEKANVDFSVSCASINPEGAYFIGIPLTSSNKLTVNVNVTSTGFWSIRTNTINGYSFSGTGTFTTAGSQTIELQGTGTPVDSGANNFNISSNATTIEGSSCSGIQVSVASVKYTINCAAATQNGTFMQDVNLIGANTITLPINVTATGQTTITTTTANGISFTSGLINLATLGEKIVTLSGSGKPVSAGITDFIVSGTPGTVGTCTIKVTTAGQPVAYQNICTGRTVTGSYAPGIAMVSTNRIIVPVNVSYVGAYTMSTNTVNGISFSAAGTFTTTGTQSVIMTASGTPTSGGTFTYTITANSTNAATACNVDIPFVFRTMNILGMGTGTYQPGSANGSQSSRAILAYSGNFGPSGKVQIQGMTIVNGSNSESTVLKNLINTNNIDIIVIGYNYTPNAASIVVLNDFVQNKRGVLIHSQENDASGTAGLINAICGSSVSASGTGSGYINPILNVSDPVLNGPFGDIRGLNQGADVNNSYYITNPPSNVNILATQQGNTSRIFSFRHNTLGYFYTGDSGWMAGSASNNSDTIWPAAISSLGAPIAKGYSGGVTVYNSIMYANAMAWAIQYAQANTKTGYSIP